MKKIFVIIIFVMASFKSEAQEFKLAPYTQYLVENPFIISPAFAGEGSMNRLRFSGVFQWVGLENAPNTQTLSYDTHILENSGAGVILYRDKNGNTSQIGGQLTFAHHLTLNESNRQYISFGLSYKFTQFRIDVSNFNSVSDAFYNPDNDPSIGGNISSFNSNFDAAILYRLERFYISFNASNILNKNVKAFDDTEPKKLRNYYLYTGYIFDIQDGEYEIEPSLYFKLFESDGRSVSDINVKGKKIVEDGYYWAGFSARFLNDQNFNAVAIVPMLGLKKQDFYVGYAFQYNINDAVELNHGGTHLLTLGYDFETSKATRW